uniref:FAD-binding PCMH-type domain-containing protein n=1 Tax=Arcella intermedia TaxID=1963864 RepID=A0A6B2L1S4_9EUKA
MNRHSCPHGVLIRTSLMKSVAWLANHQSVRLGPGITTSEAHYFASPVNRSIVTSSTPSLTLAGWALGGGHGHLNPLHGLGSDQIEAVQLVDAEGCLLSVDEHGTTRKHLDGRTEFSRSKDLLWAVRGGGAASWGVVASVTFKTHPVPAGGYSTISMTASGSFCEDGGEDFFTMLREYFSWSLTLDKYWSGQNVLVPYAGGPGACSLGWNINLFYLYHGAANVDFYATWHRFAKTIPPSITPTVHFNSYADLWEMFKGKALEPINPFPVFPPTPKTTGAIPSYLLSREVVHSGAAVEVLRRRIGKCSTVNCEMYLIFQEISGNIGSPQRGDVPLSPGMREGLFMLFPILPTLDDLGDYEPLGEYAYYSLSAWNMRDWQRRYWGNHYKRLLEIKKAYDPEHYFSCHHCVGDEEKDY